MIIKSIRLNNIRSYKEKEIILDLGSTLLSGDIGSGKSTILLAIDFALFGLSKGIITGEAILRHGEKQGSVELDFSIDDKKIRIKRSLKKIGDTVSQDSGYIVINDELFNLSPIELKQRILELLNYPQEILTKKSLIYRYTVYTPQEEMKLILIGKKEDRLDTLRKVFNIDKYKRIQENSKILSSELRLKIKEDELFISDIEYLKKEKGEKTMLQDELKVKILTIDKELRTLQTNLTNKKEELKSVEEKIKLFNELKKELELNELNLKNNSSRFEVNKQNIEKLTREIKEIENDELKEIDMDKLYKNLLVYRNKLSKVDGELLEIRKSLNESKYSYINSEKLIKEISYLDECPVCLQKVKEDHKHNILGKEDAKIKDLSENIKIYTKKENDFIKDVEIINQEIEKLNELKSKNELIKLKIRNLYEKKNNHSILLNENSNISKITEEIKNKNLIIASKIEGIGDVKYDQLKNELNLLLDDEKKLLVGISILKREVEVCSNNIILLNENLLKKEDARRKIFKLKGFRSFVDDDFLKVIETMEKKVMLRVHNDFNELFIKWFNILVDDENISVKLDEEFSPLIEQGGFTTDYIFLSGGEKTAGALAYRLALNQVINNLIVHIKTKDILILDEPTDGFSEDQLDRLRLVLDELNIKQIILVSHESKIESFVNNVIRLNKKEGVTELL